jgi:hypothetical protein
MEEGEHVMPGQHRKISCKALALRLAASVVAGAALCGSVATAAHADTNPQKSQRAAAPAGRPQDVIALARKQVGIQDNGGSTKFGRWYMTTHKAQLTVKRDGGSISDYAAGEWCDMFVSWVGDQAHVRGMGKDAYTVEHAKWFQRVGRWGSTPKPGAVVFFSWSGGGIDGIDHVGLVVKDNGNGTIQTIEGNTNNAVMARERSTDSIVGYGYPEYAK